MTELITQTELDTLQAAMEPTSVNTGNPRLRVAFYDFRHASTLSPIDLQALHHRGDSLARLLTTLLSAYLSCPLEVRLQSVEVISREQYYVSVDPTSVLGMIDFGAAEILTPWELSAPLAHLALDRMLGGSGRVTDNDMTELPPLSQAVITCLLQEILGAWSELWPTLGKFNPHLKHMYGDRPVAATGPEERLVQVALEVRLGPETGHMRLHLPVGLTRRLIRSEHLNKEPNPENIPSLPTSGILGETPVEIRIQLDGPALPLNRLLALKPGEIIDLRHGTATPFVVLVSGRPKFTAQPGNTGGRMAVQLLNELPVRPVSL